MRAIVHDSFSPVDELLDDLHPGVELVESQDVLLSEETQSRALSKVLHKNKHRLKYINQKFVS